MSSSEDQREHEQLCAYLLGELDADESASVEEALARSPELEAERQRQKGKLNEKIVTRRLIKKAQLLEAGASGIDERTIDIKKNNVHATIVCGENI